MFHLCFNNIATVVCVVFRHFAFRSMKSGTGELLVMGGETIRMRELC